MDLLLTGWRVEHEWLAAGSQNAQSETVRDFCKARRDGIKARKRGERRGHPRLRSRRRSLPTLNYTRNRFSLLPDGRLKVAGGIVLRPVWSRDLPAPRRVSGRRGMRSGAGP